MGVKILAKIDDVNVVMKVKNLSGCVVNGEHFFSASHDHQFVTFGFPDFI